MASTSENNVPSENMLSSFQLARSEFASASLNSGFDFEFVNKLDSKYECSVCLLALRHPVQTICGHRFCRDCIMSWMNSSNKECPIDKQPLNEMSLFHDSCIEREILQMKVKCPNASLGCKNQVDLRYIEDHIHACVYQPVLCPNECSVTVLQRDLEEHLSSQCLRRFTKCSSCEKVYIYNQEQIHLTECPLIHITCDLCGMEVLRRNLPEHRSSSCPSAEISCIFFEHGCQFKSNRNEMSKHCETAIKYHIQLLSAAYKKINTLVLDLYRNIGQVASGSFIRQPSLRSQPSQSSISEGQMSPLSDRTLENSLVGATGGQCSGYGNVFQGNSCNEKVEWNVGAEPRQAQQNMMETDKQSKLKEEEFMKPGKEKMEAPPVSDQEIIKNLSHKSIDVEQRVMEQTIKIDNLIRKVNSIDYSLRSQEFENIGLFCNGSFVWKIPNFSSVCEEMNKKKKVFHSPPFYTSPFGYKFGLRSNITSASGETWLTLYIHLMKSKNDEFLVWPFKGKVTFTVLDCKNQDTKLHFSEHIVIDSPMDAFKRPMIFRSMKGFGYKEFIALDHIFSDFLKDDTLHFRVDVTPQ